MLKLLLKGLLLIISIIAFGKVEKALIINDNWGNPFLRNHFEFGEEKIKQSNSLFLGSSLTKYGISAQDFDKFNKNEKSYNISTGNLTMPQTYFLAEKLITDKSEYPKLENIYLELSLLRMPKNENINSTQVRYYMDWGHFKFVRDAIDHRSVLKTSKENKYKFILETFFENTFGVSMSSTEISNYLDNQYTRAEYIKKDIGYKNYYDDQKEERWVRTAESRKTQWLRKVNNIKQLTRKRFQVRQASQISLIQYLSDLHKLGKENGVNVNLVFMPRLNPPAFKVLKPIFSKYPGNKISFSSPKKFPELWDYCENGMDAQHLNYDGAVLLTEHLSEFHQRILANQ